MPVIAAASSVKFALQDITRAFHQDTGKSVRISYSSSGNLTRQIQQGSPFELFLSANSIYIDQLYQQQKTLDKGTVYALGRMAILTTKNSPILLDTDLHKTKQALQKGQIQYFSIANPEHAPYGVAAREILQKLNLWEQIQPHLVLGENAAQATQFASSGKDVPAETTTTPIAKREILSFFPKLLKSKILLSNSNSLLLT